MRFQIREGHLSEAMPLCAPGYNVEARSHEARECGTLKIGPLTAQ
jgi:hypothetical protein